MSVDLWGRGGAFLYTVNLFNKEILIEFYYVTLRHTGR